MVGIKSAVDRWRIACKVCTYPFPQSFHGVVFSKDLHGDEAQLNKLGYHRIACIETRRYHIYY